MEERIETTVPKAKALRPHVEKMITLGKRGDLAARRRAAAYLMTSAAVDKLFDTVGPRFGDRQGGYLRIVRSDGTRATAPTRLSSNCWAAKRSWKKSVRSAPKSVRSAPPKPRRPWKTPSSRRAVRFPGLRKKIRNSFSWP